MHTITSAHLIRELNLTADMARYLAHNVGLPISVPTPIESRALSEIGRCRRHHSDLVDRHHPRVVGVTATAIDFYQRASQLHRDILRINCEIVRRERLARGV